MTPNSSQMQDALTIFAQLAVRAASEHLDRRTLLRVGKIEADNFGGLAR
jgi:hypothetical protein